MLKALFTFYSSRARARRGAFLGYQIALRPEHRILDLGGGRGAHFHGLFPDHRNVVVADISPGDLAAARADYGYETVQLSADAQTLPFADKAFDFVFCSSVIEHVTGPKDQMAWTTDSAHFETVGRSHQRAFAHELRRITRGYYVQTPYRFFLVESHSWLPGFISVLPRRWLVAVLRCTNLFWPKKTAPDWRLLTIAEFSQMFPDAQIHREWSLGFVKSLMAIKRP